MKDRIEHLIDLVASTCIPWIKEVDGIVQLVDPLDHEEISAHYGATHAAVALIIYGKEKNDSCFLKLGEALLFSIFHRWEKNKILPGFHNDFNNYALCVLDSYTKEYHDSILKIVMNTADSNHDTINWLPMRWYVNKCRYEWSQDKKYLKIIKMCTKKIKAATFNDGFIDDRLPVGTSFNLQYDVATVSVMQFLRVCGERIDLRKEVGALLNAVCPDGDINYLGRGTNQIFAWGLWVYLLASSKQDELGRALDYLEHRLPAMLENNNLMLNEFAGCEKYMWWDYHYCSVYTAHLFMWLVLAWKDIGKASIIPELVDDGSSGVHIYKNDRAFVVLFDGRTEYLAERGPIIAALWQKKYGTICKGAFGPWMGDFGNLYCNKDNTLSNYCGLVDIDIGKHCGLVERVLRKMHVYPCNASETIRVQFTKTDCKITENLIEIKWTPHRSGLILNIPVLSGVGNMPEILLFNSEERKLEFVKTIKTQYGYADIYQSKLPNNEKLEIVARMTIEE